MSYWSLLSITAPVLAVMAAGWFVRRVGWLSHEADASVLRLVVNLLYPCLVFESTLANAAARAPRNLETAPLAGFASLAIALGVAWLAGGAARVTPGPVRRTFTFATGVHNYGYVAIPLVQQLYPAALGVHFVYSLGVEVAFWTLAMAVLCGAGERSMVRRVANPAIVAIVLGLVMNLTGAGSRVPTALLGGIHVLAVCAVPLALLVIGATLADELGGKVPFAPSAAPEARSRGATPGSQPDGRRRAVLVGSVVRLCVLPLLSLVVVRALPLTPELKQVLVVQSAMPSAVLPILLTKHYGGHLPTVVWIAIATNALGLLTIPLWIRLGMALVGV
jgi:predicted permease